MCYLSPNMRKGSMKLVRMRLCSSYLNNILLLKTKILKVLFFIAGVVGQKCYVCKDQDENTGKCTTTVESCDFTEDYCLSEIKWGSQYQLP